MNMVKTLKVLGATSAIAGLAFTATAATFTQNSFIEILDALNVTEDTQLNFGVIENPSAPVTVVVTTAGAVDAASTATHIDDTIVAAGAYTITGTDGSTVSITATDGANVPGLSFTGITGSFGGAADADLLAAGITGAALAGGTGSLAVGAELTVADTVPTGEHAPEFDLVVNYE